MNIKFGQENERLLKPVKTQIGEDRHSYLAIKQNLFFNIIKRTRFGWENFNQQMKIKESVFSRLNYQTRLD
jgi:hypothetical protein